MMSVIIPTHNRRELLMKKLHALEVQNPSEVIVVADGCTDDTVQVLQLYSPSYSLRFMETPGKGAAFARNAGAREAKGDYLLFSDDDVISKVGWLEAHHHASAPGAVVVGKLVLPSHLKYGATMTGPKAFWWNATGANSSMPRSLFLRAGGYDESFAAYGGEDPDLGWRLKGAGATFIFVENAVAEHWDEGFEESLVRKATAAGRAHVKVWQKHGANEIAWALGVHPMMLGAKRFTLPLLKPMIGKRGDYEIAYMQGAISELQKRATVKSS